MKKVIAALLVAFVAAVVSLGLTSPAQAYPDNPPTEVSPPQVNSAAPESNQAAAATSNSTELPSTGGPHALLLGSGVALVLAGGAFVVVARRRQTI